MKLKENLIGLTEWFPDGVNPIHVGLYEIECELFGGRYFSYWNGKRWGFRCATKDRAFLHKDKKATGPVVKWRGLAKKP